MKCNMATGNLQTKKIYPVQVGKQFLLLEVCIIAQSNTCINLEKPSKCGKKHESEVSCEWFKEVHLHELLNGLAGIVIGRIYSTRPITRAAHQYLENSHDTTQNLKFSYCFKKRFSTAMQYALLKNMDKIYHLNGKTSQRKTNYKSLQYFHEKLAVSVWQHVTKMDQHNEDTKEREIDVKPGTSSDYFTEQTDCQITSSVKRKKASLKNMAKKSKINALLRLPNEESESSTDSVKELVDSNIDLQIISSFTNNMRCHSNKVFKVPDVHIEKTVIDLEQEPEGLMDIKRVEDLQIDQLKFLIYKMEGRLRSIFRGEVYCRRHEDYKKGGKDKDNLNFQVGMAHFSEDQHECIMDTLMAIFCYKHIWYMDYVTKVMLPEALIKLYQDIHKTSFDQAEECLINDSIY